MSVRVLLPLLFLFPVLSFAQLQPVGHLTIFSDDGDKFFLILNGERMNNEPQTNIRVEDLPQPYYKAKIIFENKAIPEISKNIQIADPEGILMDVTYKIKSKDGKGKLNYYSAIPVRQGFIAPPNMYVAHFGAPLPPPVVVSQTTTTTTTSNTIGANMKVNGVNVGISVSDPTMGSTTMQTTTTSYSSDSYEERRGGRGRNHGDCYEMSRGDFQAAKATISKENFDGTKLSMAKNIASGNCLNAEQVFELCQMLGYDSSRLEFAKFAYGRTVDPGNYFKVNNAFQFSTSKDELNEYIQGH